MFLEENTYDEYENDLGITAIALYDYQAGKEPGAARGRGGARAPALRPSPARLLGSDSASQFRRVVSGLWTFHLCLDTHGHTHRHTHMRTLPPGRQQTAASAAGPRLAGRPANTSVLSGLVSRVSLSLPSGPLWSRAARSLRSPWSLVPSVWGDLPLVVGGATAPCSPRGS